MSIESHTNWSMRCLIGLLAIASFDLGCATGAGTTVQATAPNDWVLGRPSEAGFDEAELDRIGAAIEAGEFPNTHALLIEHDGVLVYERYFSGTDERWGVPVGWRKFGPESLHDLRSISKSVTSALLGISIGDDFASAVEKSIFEYFPELELGQAQGAITLHQVLTMTAGLQWNEMTVPYTSVLNDEIQLYSAPDPAEYVLKRPMETPAGSSWYYNGGLTQVLASILYASSGQSLSEYARIHFFEPLGISNYEWLGPEDWTPDNPAAMSGLRLRARDLAKIGSVYLHGGRWQGRQIVPAAWVERSTTRFVAEIGDWSNAGMWGYGYQWWVGQLPDGQRIVAGFGIGNQRLFLLPEAKLVITVLAGDYNRYAGHSDRLLRRVLEAQVNSAISNESE